jgi:hypothetical protein
MTVANQRSGRALYFSLIAPPANAGKTKKWVDLGSA